MVLVGYSEPKQAFKVINSWGNGWGENGFGWISYAALQKRVHQAWVIAPQPGETRKPDPVVMPDPPRPAPAAFTQAALDRLLAGLTGPELCGSIRGRLGSSNQVKLTGFVGRDSDIKPIEAALKSRGVEVSRHIDVRPWPQCEVLVNLDEPLSQAHGLKLSVSGATVAELARNETISIEVTTPDTPSYLYLTYVQADGNAVHLSRPVGPSPEPLRPHTRTPDRADVEAGRQ